MKKIIFILLLCCSANLAFAGNLDTNYVQSIASQAPLWALSIVPMAIKIFMIVWAMETFAQCVTHHFFDFTKLKELFRFLAVRIIFMSFFTAVLVYPSLYLGITQLFTKLGAAGMGHIQGSSSNGIGIDPGWIWTQFTQWWTMDYPAAMAQIPLSHIGDQVGLAIGSLVYMGCSIYISFLVILLDVEAIMIVYGALVLTGFAGSKWTKKWWESYLSMVVGIGLRIMIFSLMYGVLQQIMMYKSGSTGGASIDVWSQIVTTLLATMCLGIVPGKIAGGVSSAAGSGGELLAAALGAVAMGAKLASAGVNMLSKDGGAIDKLKDGADKVMNDLMKEAGEGGSEAVKSMQPVADQTSKSDFLKSDDGGSANSADGSNDSGSSGDDKHQDNSTTQQHEENNTSNAANNQDSSSSSDNSSNESNSAEKGDNNAAGSAAQPPSANQDNSTATDDKAKPQAISSAKASFLNEGD